VAGRVTLLLELKSLRSEGQQQIVVKHVTVNDSKFVSGCWDMRLAKFSRSSVESHTLFLMLVVPPGHFIFTH
jgi:hypothetical protein